MDDELIEAMRLANNEMRRAEDALGSALTLLSGAIADLPVEAQRRVWIATVSEGDEHGVGPVEVLIEQFGDNAPTVAFRRGGNPAVWGRPFRGESRG